jgi:glutathione S-transferase
MSARYTLTIGSKNWSSWSLRPWLAMKVAGIAFDEVMIPLRRPDTKTAIAPRSPSGKIPALSIAENGRDWVVWDSLAICETLAERHPECRLWPGDAQDRAQARSVAAEMHSGFACVRTALPTEIAARHPTPDLDAATEAEIARIVMLWTAALGAQRNGEGFLFGRFSIADAFYAPVVTRFATYGIALAEPAASYAERILALPAMREWTEAAREEAASVSSS